MKKITKDNLIEFMDYYCSFHDSYITNINYNISEARIELLLDVFWSGQPTLNEDGTYNTNKTKLKMIFNDVEKYSSEEIYYTDYIDDAYIKYIKLNNKEYICFATDEVEPSFYVVCESIEYEEINS